MVAELNFRAPHDAIEALWAQARASHQRRLAWLSGDPRLSRELVSRLLETHPGLDPHWHGGGAPAGLVASHGREAFRFLGGECGLLVFNAWSGFDPDAFGALAGTLRGGGLMFLLTPAADRWPELADPENARVAVAPHTAEEVGNRYLRRLVRELVADTDSLWIEDGKVRRRPDAVVASAAERAAAEPPCRTLDQQRAVEAVVHVATGHRRRPVVLRSDRGRGKSAAFGIAAARLVAARDMQVLVTGPRRQAVDAVLMHAREQLPAALHDHLRYLPPDALAQQPVDADLLLVDEAAAISTPLLERLLRRYPRVAFATTVHGYEGTGRGFALRFSRVLDRYSNSWKTVTLAAPVRWSPGDPLEPLVFRLLMLDATAAPDASLEPYRPQQARIEQVSRDALFDDEASLRELFGLLVLAHYKTRPFDLRQLLDGPNLSVYLARVDGHVAAAALVAREGGFDAGAAREIAAGRRRPHGHLLPETLAVHLGVRDAPRMHAARVMRIAVHPAVQGRGFGTRLLSAIEEQAAAQGLDYLGSCFGASEDLLRFWRRAGWRPVRLSERRGASSGFHSVVVMKALTSDGAALLTRARGRFLRHFPYQLGDSLRELDVALVTALMREAPEVEQALSAEDLADVESVARELRFPEAAAGALWNWLRKRLLSSASLDAVSAQDAELLVGRLMQRRDWGECARRAGLSGHAETLQRLRDVLRQLLD